MNGEADRVFAFDFDGDGKSDLFLYRPDSGLAWWRAQTATGTFTAVYLSGNGIAGYDLAAAATWCFRLTSMATARATCSCTGPNSGLACVARSNGDGTFTAGVSLRQRDRAATICCGVRDQAMPFDFNGDGKSDLFLYRPDSGLACVARSNGDGTFTQVYFSAAGIGGYDLRGRRDMAFPFDFNGDGKRDIFFFRQEGHTASVVQSGVAVPDLLARVENPLGGVTEIAYTASSRCENHLLPFIVHPVSAISGQRTVLPESPACGHPLCLQRRLLRLRAEGVPGL